MTEGKNTNVMSAKSNESNSRVKCFTCGKVGHKSYQCSQEKGEGKKNMKTKRWCDNCKSNTHDTKYCRKKSSVKVVSNNDTCDDGSNNNENNNEVMSHNFAFKASCSKPAYVNNNLLVDCGATADIITDKSKFKIFDANFEHNSHSIELADGSRTTGIVVGKGVASVNLWGTHGMVQSVELRTALYIASYKQDIFSVKAATE